eukprot:1771-Heterococcus_DN1.PRE.3
MDVHCAVPLKCRDTVHVSSWLQNCCDSTEQLRWLNQQRAEQHNPSTNSLEKSKSSEDHAKNDAPDQSPSFRQCWCSAQSAACSPGAQPSLEHTHPVHSLPRGSCCWGASQQTTASATR